MIKIERERLDEYKIRTRKFLLGSREKRGFIPALVSYVILITLGFVYVYPVIYMLITSVKSPVDTVDPMVIWVPTQLFFQNYAEAFTVLKYGEAFYVSMMMSVVPAVLQTLSTALAGYALARFNFPLKKLWLVMIIMMFVVPVQVTTIPRYMMYLNYNIIGTPWVAYLPAIVGQGIKSGIFILIFYQFFHSYPKSFDEAAELDGCNRFKIFYRIALPMSGPAIVISIIFSVVWYWNETIQSSLFFGRANSAISLFFVKVSSMRTLPMRLSVFNAQFQELHKGEGATLTDSVSLAGACLTILPVLILYLVLQKQFVESVERSGITGE